MTADAHDLAGRSDRGQTAGERRGRAEAIPQTWSEALLVTARREFARPSRCAPPDVFRTPATNPALRPTLLATLVLTALALAPGAVLADAASRPQPGAKARTTAGCVAPGSSKRLPPRRCARQPPPLVRTNRDGEVSLPAALDAFAEATGIVPGTGEKARVDPRFTSGSGPLRWILAHRDRLSKSQLRTVEAVVNGRRPHREHDQRAAAAGPHLRGPPNLQAEWEALVSEAVGRISTRLGRPFGLTYSVNIQPTQVKNWFAATGAFNADGGTSGTAKTCVINVYPKVYTLSDLSKKRTTAAHEVWHCFQAELLGLDAYYSPKTPPWLIEGSATWVGGSIAEDWTGPGYSDFALTGWWKNYLNSPGRPLYKRSYDALGFFAHLSHNVYNPWNNFDAMFQASKEIAGNEAIFVQAVSPNANAFFDEWPSGFLRFPAWGPKWNLVGPGIGNTVGKGIPYVKLNPGTSATVTAPNRANAVRALDLAAPLTVLKLKPGGSAHGVLRDANGVEYPLQDTNLCTEFDGCCPPDKKPKDPTVTVARDVAILALNGGAVPATATLKGQTAKSADCEPLPPTALSIVSPSGEFPGRAITTPGQCFLSGPREDGTRAWVLNFPGFQLAVPQFTGARQYGLPGAPNRGPLSPYANASVDPDPLNTGVGPWYTSAVQDPAGAGSFTVDDGLRSGTVGTSLWAPEGVKGKPITVSGNWSCVQEDAGYFPGLPIGR